MKRTSVWVSFAVVVCVLVLCVNYLETRTPTVTPRSPSPPNINGKWFQLSRMVNGKAMDDPPDLFLLINDGRMEHHVPNGSGWLSGSTIVGNHFFRLEWRDEVAFVDNSDRSDWTQLTKGICRLDGDTLTLCYAAKDQPRPSVFATGDAEGQGSLMMIFRRYK